MTFNSDALTLYPTMHLRFVLRDVASLDVKSNNYDSVTVKILQQWFQPAERYIGVISGEWRDVPLVTGDSEA